MSAHHAPLHTRGPASPAAQLQATQTERPARLFWRRVIEQGRKGKQKVWLVVTFR
jgi:hypothetical protein